MRLLSESFSVALLVGCLTAAVAMAGEREGSVFSCNSPYKNRRPTPEGLATVLRNHQAWLESDRKRDNERRANLCQAELEEANLQAADLPRANLQAANLQDANLQAADLRMANLQAAILVTSRFEGARLSEANLTGAAFEIGLGSLPVQDIPSLTRAGRLDTLKFYTSPHTLIELREAFKKTGLRQKEREITYAIEHTWTLLAWNPTLRDPTWWDITGLPNERDPRPWLEQLAGKIEGLFRYMLFALPCDYGMAPGRAMWGLLGLIPIFAFPYWLAIKYGDSRSGLWVILPEDRLASRSSKKKTVLLRPPKAKTRRECLAGEARMLRTGLYFSLLSAFHLGWREYNVGTWIARLQPREYTLRATGWVRTVAGIQSLISVYLLAL